jgi:hypothetical protein
MIINFNKCPLTGTEKLDNKIFEVQENPLLIHYKNLVIGEVIIPTSLFTMLEGGKYKEIFPIVVGILRENYLTTGKPFNLSTNFFESEYKTYPYPKSFNEKANHYLRYLYYNGGNEYKTFQIYPKIEYSLSYATSPEEFYRILTKLELENFIEFLEKIKMESGEIVQAKILLTQKSLKKF